MIIGVSSFGCTGSSAVYDLLREYEEIKTPRSGRECEFTLPYSPSGLAMLEFCLYTFPVKHEQGDSAIGRFINLTKTIEKSYNRETNGAFSRLTKEYLGKIIQVKYKGFKAVGYTSSRIKWILTLLSRKAETYLRKITNKSLKIAKRLPRYISVRPEGFIENTRQYVMGIIGAMGAEPGGKFLLDQPFPPNYPESVFKFFDNPYAIVVDRDPRDIYAIAKHMNFRSWEFIPHDSVEDFVTYFRVTHVKAKNEDPARVLRVRFEDFIYQYDQTVREVEEFLDIHNHINPNKFFQKEISGKNTQVFRAFPEDASEIHYIEEQLPEYLYSFEKYYKIVSKDEINKTGRYTKYGR